MAINLGKLIQAIVNFAADEVNQTEALKAQASQAIADAATAQKEVVDEKAQIAALQAQLADSQAKVVELQSAEATLVAIAQKFGIPVEQLPEPAPATDVPAPTA